MFKSILQTCLLISLFTGCAPRAHHGGKSATRATENAPTSTPAPQSSSDATPTVPAPEPTATIPAPEATPTITVAGETESPDQALARITASALAELASDFNIKFSAGKWISYPMFVSYRIYTAEQRALIYQHLIAIQDACTQRLKNVEEGQYALDRQTADQVYYDKRHIGHLIDWMKTYERSLEENKK